MTLTTYRIARLAFKVFKKRILLSFTIDNGLTVKLLRNDDDGLNEL